MTVHSKPFAILRGVLLIGLAVLVLTIYSSRAGTAFPSRFNLPIDMSSETVLPARIEPGSLSNIVSEFPARVASVHVQTGSAVEAGDTLVVLENKEISVQIEAAEKRLAAAAAHLDTFTSQAAAAITRNLAQERMRSAQRNRDLARQRLQAFKVSDSEAAFQAARERLAAIQPLVQRGLATEAELHEYERRLEADSRDLEAAREHQSRLSQELDQAESQIRLLDLQVTASSHDPSSFEADYADAKAAFMAAQERGSRLVIKATGRGTVLSLGVRQDEWIHAGTSIARIADLSTLTIAAPVTAKLAQSIQVGRPLSVLLPGAGAERLPSFVSDVTLVPDATHQVYLIKAVITNPDPKTILVGLDAQMEFEHLDVR